LVLRYPDLTETDDSVFRSLMNIVEPGLSPGQKGILLSLKDRPPLINIDRPNIILPSRMDISSYLTLSRLHDMLTLPVIIPSTPPRKSPFNSQDVLGATSISPPSAMLRSPLPTLTKTYAGDSFRQARQVSSRQVRIWQSPRVITLTVEYVTKQNTSRLPSLHVDNFQPGTRMPLVHPQQFSPMQGSAGSDQGL